MQNPFFATALELEMLLGRTRLDYKCAAYNHTFYLSRSFGHNIGIINSMLEKYYNAWG